MPGSLGWNPFVVKGFNGTIIRGRSYAIVPVFGGLDIDRGKGRAKEKGIEPMFITPFVRGSMKEYDS
jgi:hypothetical protein